MAGETLLNQRYELVAQQGSGGMSVIYRALDRMLGRIVAVKILRPNLTKGSEGPAFVERFQQEARTFAMMSHPNIVTIHDVGSDGATYYIVMEMIDGDDLKKLIKTRGALPIDKALDLGIQICAALGFAHRSQMVHADVKPQNVLINRDGVVKVTDFGIAQALTDTLPQTRSEVVWGSPHYFSPEQAKGEKPTPASDVYSIGIVLFEMFTGRLPYVGRAPKELAIAHLRGKIPIAKDFNPDLPEALSNVIAKVMSKRPNDRYKHADQLGHILQEIRERSRQSARGIAPGRLAPPTVAAQQPARRQPHPPAPQPRDHSGVRATGAIPIPRRPAAPPAAEANATSPPLPGLAPIPRSPLRNPDGTINVEATGGYTGPFVPKRQAKGEGADIVTIILVILAFLAVAGLAPLYLLGVFPLL
ncbi:MAG: protein kinase [Chloroflexota bacterium]|nr:protein kinase [Chloroflexota bacterium]MDE2947047.1 protein kinase [Chloroflexota bacterium]